MQGFVCESAQLLTARGVARLLACAQHGQHSAHQVTVQRAFIKFVLPVACSAAGCDNADGSPPSCDPCPVTFAKRRRQLLAAGAVAGRLSCRGLHCPAARLGEGFITHALPARE